MGFIIRGLYGIVPQGFRGLGFGVWWFRALGFRGLGFRVWWFRL